MRKVDIPECFGFLFEPARYKAAFGGRGSGKSHSFATGLLLHGVQQPRRILCAREVQRSLKESVKQLLDDKIAALDLENVYDSIQSAIRGVNGTTFMFAGLGDLTVDQIKSYEGVDIVWVEEAQTISSRSLEVLIPTIRKPGSELWFTWNPRHESDPVDQRFRGMMVPPGAVVRRVNYDDNPFFPAELEQERQYDKIYRPDRYGHIWLGEYEPLAVGAIWNRQVLHDHRRSEIPPMERILVSVDHATSAEEKSNEHGVIAGGIGEDQRGYVLEDASLKGTPNQWANRAVALFDKWEADAVVIERNQGGDLVRNTLETVRPGLPVIEVHASRGKHVRAEPIASLYSFGRISHVGTFPELENQMCQMTAAGYEGEGSPDRCDALVWLLSELFPSMVEKKDQDMKKLNPLRRTRRRAHGFLGA